MDEIGKKLLWLLIIFPGFLTVAIVSAIVDLGDIGEFSFLFYSLALTLFNVALALTLSLIVVFTLRYAGYTLSLAGQLAVFASLTLVIAVCAGIWIGIGLERGTFFQWVRQVPVVNVLNKRSSARPMIFLLRRNTGGLLAHEGDGRPKGQKVGEAWMRVHLQEGAIYEGWPEFYDNKPTEIYLSPACKIEETATGATAMKVPGPGVIIPEARMDFAVLLDRSSSPCFLQWFPPAKP